MVKDLIIKAMYMLDLQKEALRAQSFTGNDTDEFTYTFLTYANLVIDEVGGEYRRDVPLKDFYECTDAVPDFYGISGRVLSYGIAAEFCITKGLADAEMWDKRYKDALMMAKQKSKRIKVKKPLIGG